jgi:hypothetical protein
LKDGHRTEGDALEQEQGVTQFIDHFLEWWATHLLAVVDDLFGRGTSQMSVT